MKNIYWRPRKISRTALVWLTVAAIGAMTVLELAPDQQVAGQREAKLEASRLAAVGMDLIKAERLRRGHDIVAEFDPGETGMIGQSMSLVTSVPGHLGAKQTSVNPNFAAVVVEMLQDSGVAEGDLVAVGCSGSFPALNVCVFAALETLGARPVVISSAAASQFGANIPDLMWVDMERELFESGLVSFRSVAASYGGYEDRGLGMSDQSIELITAALDRNELSKLESDSLDEAISKRMNIYERESHGGKYKAYINVGGGASSVGRTEGKHLYDPGMNETPDAEALAIDSVMTRFAEQGIPLVHLVQIKQLADQYGLPQSPELRPEPGTGGIFVRQTYDRPLAVIFLCGLSFVLCGLVLTGFRRPFVRLAEMLHLHRQAQGPRLTVMAAETQGGELMV